MTLRLLVADESVTMQKMVRLAYATEDAEIEAVFNGDAALDILYEFRPDVILAAVSMPGYNGYEVCELIRQDPEFATLPVILLAGAFDPFDEEEAVRVEASGHLTKPFDTSEMIEMIERLRPESSSGQHPVHRDQGEGFEESHELSNPAAELTDTEAAESEAPLAFDRFEASQPESSQVPESSQPESSKVVEVAEEETADSINAVVHTDPPAILPKLNFDVAPRSLESFLGPARILEIFNDQATTAVDDWPISEKLIDRVAEKVVDRILPQIENLVRQTHAKP